MKCPDCQSELVKGKTGYLCLHCGYSGKSIRSSQAKAVAEPAEAALESPPDEPVEASTDSKIDQSKATKVKPSPNITPVIAEAHIAPRSKSTLHDHEPTESLVERALAGSRDDDAALSLSEIMTKQPAPHFASSVQPVPAAEPPTPHQSHSNPRLRRNLTLAGMAIVLLAGLLLAYILPARAAGKALTAKLGSASSLHYTGSLVLVGSSFLSVLDSNLVFNGTYAAKSANQFNYTGTFASRNYQGSFITGGGKLYSRMTGNDLPFIRYNQGIATYHITPGDWYSTKADTSLYKYYCETKPDTKYPSPLVWYQAIRQIKLHPSPLVSYGSKMDGHTTTHLRGSIAAKDLGTAWSNINSSLPPGCEWNNQIEDLTGMDVKFDAWTSKDYDQIQLHLSDKDLGLKGTITLKFDQYNAAPAVVIPTTTKNLVDIFSGRADIQARDYTRRANVDALKVALDAYAKANKATPPSSLSKLAPKYIAAVPKDPSGSDYKYSVTKKTYSLQATLEDAGQLYILTGP